MNKLLHVLHTCSTICPTIPVFSFCLHLNKIILEVLYLKNNKQTLPPVNSSLEREGEGYIPLLKHSIFFIIFVYFYLFCKLQLKNWKLLITKLLSFFTSEYALKNLKINVAMCVRFKILWNIFDQNCVFALNAIWGTYSAPQYSASGMLTYFFFYFGSPTLNTFYRF